MKGPSFFVEEETPESITILYRSKRRGFAYYVIGQMKEIAKINYKISNLVVTVVEQKVEFDTFQCRMK